MNGNHAISRGSHLLHCALGGPSAVINEILLMDKVLPGEEALQLGIVNRVAGDAKGAAYELATKISTQHPVAIRAMLQTIRSVKMMDLNRLYNVGRHLPKKQSATIGMIGAKESMRSQRNEKLSLIRIIRSNMYNT
jgi:enoyl-CoA hydratase/carnithine racemase